MGATLQFSFTIPRRYDSVLEVPIAAPDIVFLLGANGTGKSSLLHRLYIENHSYARRITAHRQTWIESNAITFAPTQRLQVENHIRGQDRNPQARWSEYDPSARASLAIYDLVDAENVRARDITSALDSDDFDLVKELRKKDAPIKIINELLKLSGIPVDIKIQERTQVVAIKNESNPYSISELSDGERNALLIAANVLRRADKHSYSHR
jgi:ATPase subunit of ABC transporter with duplicated ATPase domains